MKPVRATGIETSAALIWYFCNSVAGHVRPIVPLAQNPGGSIVILQPNPATSTRGIVKPRLSNLDTRLVPSVHGRDAKDAPWHRASRSVHHGTVQRHAHVRARSRNDPAPVHAAAGWRTVHPVESRGDHTVDGSGDGKEGLSVPFIPDPLRFRVGQAPNVDVQFCPGRHV